MTVSTQYLYHPPRDRRGTLLIFILIFGAAAMTIITVGAASYAIFEHRASLRVAERDRAFEVAEAGINYYRWHLAHNPTDFTDGTGQAGPFEHPYHDKNNNEIGRFSLTVTPPLAGSTVITVRSVGWTTARPDIRRTIEVRLGFPALADYTFLTNANMQFSVTSLVHGVVHSNGGIRFDGTTDSWVRSAKDRYQYLNQTHDGVWGSGGPKSFWQYPVPAIDFFAVTADVAALRDAADNGGVHLTSSGVEGWHVVFRSTTFDLYRVTSRDCHNGEGEWRYRRWTGWYFDGNIYCYDIGNQTFVRNQALPANGALFVEDDVWVEGTVDGRVTVGSGRLPVQQPYKKIYIANNLLYAAKASDDVVGLMAQGDIVVPYEAPDVMEIDAGILAQFGKIYRPYYYDSLKDTLTVFGSQIGYDSGGWKYVNGWGHVVSGFVNTDHRYDGNLKFFPPPSFPVSGTYELLSWEEIE
ncbi:MAG: hypothetical protein HY984_01925 [Candidatus Magasanikbacteria bacterium]|nr:hypothetical protein [Candidatus Magasanikbacteria bacterium]